MPKSKPTRRGRPCPQGRGKSFCVYLRPNEQRGVLAFGDTIQDGIRRLIADAVARESLPEIRRDTPR